MEAKGLVPETFEIKVSWVSPIPEVCQAFGIPGNREILKLVRLRGLKNNPFVYFISYFHPRVGLTGEEDFSRPLYDILEQDYSTIAKLSRRRSVPARLKKTLPVDCAFQLGIRSSSESVWFTIREAGRLNTMWVIIIQTVSSIP